MMRLCRLLQEELEADVSLCTASGCLRAHRAVLLARAPHLLRGQLHKDPAIIHLPGYELSGLKDLLRYCRPRVQGCFMLIHRPSVNFPPCALHDCSFCRSLILYLPGDVARLYLSLSASHRFTICLTGGAKHSVNHLICRARWRWDVG